jgi:hypothetical protein
VTIPELVMWATVLFVGIPSAWRNPTAAALVMAWFAGQAFYLVTGNNLPTEFYPFTDIFVLAVIFSKPEICNLAPYRSVPHQMICIVLERSHADRIVMLIFPLMWLAYAADIGEFSRWYALWGLCLVQFAAAGIEAFHSRRRYADADDRPDEPGALLIAYQGATRGYG